MGFVFRFFWIPTTNCPIRMILAVSPRPSSSTAKAASSPTIWALLTGLALVQKNYVAPVSTKQRIKGALPGMLESLDPQSAYLTPDFYKDLKVETRGSFGGLGIEITTKNSVLRVVAPIEDTPAYKAG